MTLRWSHWTGLVFLKHSKVSKDGAYEATRDGKSKKISIVLILCHKMLGKHCHWSVKYRSSLIVMLIVTMIELMMMAKVVIMMEVKGGGRVACQLRRSKLPPSWTRPRLRSCTTMIIMINLLNLILLSTSILLQTKQYDYFLNLSRSDCHGPTPSTPPQWISRSQTLILTSLFIIITDRITKPSWSQDQYWHERARCENIWYFFKLEGSD